MRVFTVGHSTHPIGVFIAMLKAHGVTQLADIRTIARSRYNPQYNDDALRAALAAEGIGYHALKALGGRRAARKDSRNRGWRDGGFRGYADYMQTAEFVAGMERLLALAEEGATAIMCAESVPWRCHRSLVADALLARGAEVVDIFSATQAKPHVMTDFARVEDGWIIYPGAPDLLDALA
jgi:uncharacterized protein (DUF488 family)